MNPLPPLIDKPHLSALRAALGASDAPLLIAIHDYPDPDAIAAALAFQTLARSWGINSVIAHGGVIGRDDNTEMVRLLKIDMKSFAAIPNLDDYRGALLLDTQPLARNQSLPASVPVLAVIDHHVLSDDSVRVMTRRMNRPTSTDVSPPAYSDIRLSVGASSTLALGYLAAAGITPDARLATALFLGIKTDTDGLLRFAGPYDIYAYATLLSIADLGIANRATHPPFDRSYYMFLHATMEKTTIYGSSALALCGPIKSPDMLSMASDFLIPLKGVCYALAVGFHQDRAYLSLRAAAPRENATPVLLHIVGDGGKGGGHNLTAGGFIAGVTDPSACIDLIRLRFLEATDATSAPGEPLIST